MAVEKAVERKIVSILFADLVGFTSLSERLDAEDVAAVQGAYFDTVRQVIGRYGGQLEKFIGDAAMAVFGVPVTRDDDAERAVRAALALTSAIEQLGARVGLERDALAVRVGVNSGEVVHSLEAGPGDAVVTGDPVNVAARLQAAAAPGEVLVGPTTALAVAATVDLADAQPLELKGKAEAVLARGVTGVRPEPSRDAAMGALRAPLLGRDAELTRLLDEVEARRARASPGARRGAAGCRQDEARRRARGARPRSSTRTRAASSGSALALRARRDSSSSPLARATSRCSAERLGAAGASDGRIAAVVEEVAALLRPANDATPAERESRFAAWVEALDALAGDRTGLWIVEDVHWAGGDLLAFLSFAGEAPGGRLVLPTSRPALLETAGDWCASAEPFELSSLPTAAASELVRALVGDALPAELVSRIADASDGNPLFIEELLRTWISVGTLLEDDGKWTLARPADDVTLPSTVQSIYAAQLDDLPPTARNVARRASVAGRRFPFAALDPLEIVDATRGVELLARRALVSGPTADELFGPSYAYRHALLRDAGYASLARADRARLHVGLAGWLEVGPEAGSAQVAELIGRHYARALESVPALAREVAPELDREECRRRAALWLERAAEAALELAAHESARELLRRALDLTGDAEPQERARRLTTLGEVTAATADMDEGARLLEEALELARTAEDRGAIARAAAALSWVLDLQVQFMPAARMAQRALDEIGERDDLETAVLLVRRGTAISNGSDDIDGPRADAERALRIARGAGDRRLELEAMGLLAGMSRASLDDWRELERLARDSGAWDTAADALFTQALVLVPDHADDARLHAERAIELCEARGLREALAWSHYATVEVGLVSGDWDGAIAAARRALDLGVPSGYDRAVVRTWSAVLPIAAARSERALVEEAHVWLTERFREPESPSPYALIMQSARRARARQPRAA